VKLREIPNTSSESTYLFWFTI